MTRPCSVVLGMSPHAERSPAGRRVEQSSRAEVHSLRTHVAALESTLESTEEEVVRHEQALQQEAAARRAAEVRGGERVTISSRPFGARLRRRAGQNPSDSLHRLLCFLSPFSTHCQFLYLTAHRTTPSRGLGVGLRAAQALAEHVQLQAAAQPVHESQLLAMALERLGVRRSACRLGRRVRTSFGLSSQIYVRTLVWARSDAEGVVGGTRKAMEYAFGHMMPVRDRARLLPLYEAVAAAAAAATAAEGGVDAAAAGNEFHLRSTFVHKTPTRPWTARCDSCGARASHT